MLNVPTVYTPVVQVFPTDHDFGKVPIGERAKVRIIITNHDGCHLHISNIQLGDAADSAFRLPKPPLVPLVVASQSSTEVEVGFYPRTRGAKIGSVEITGDDPIRPLTKVSLRGVGI